MKSKLGYKSSKPLKGTPFLSYNETAEMISASSVLTSALLVVLLCAGVSCAVIQQGPSFPTGISINGTVDGTAVTSGQVCGSLEEGSLSYSMLERSVLVCDGETWRSLSLAENGVQQSASTLLKLLRSSPETLTSEECLSVCPGVCSYEFVVLCDRPLGFWRLNELDGDNSGVAIEYARRGAQHGTYGSTSRLLKGWEKNHVNTAACGYRAVSNQALFFNRPANGASRDTSMEVSVPHSSIFNTVFTGAFAIELWLKDHSDVPAPGNENPPQINWSIFYKSNPDLVNSIWIYRTRTTGNYLLLSRDLQNDEESLSGPTSLEIGDQQWHHYVYEFNKPQGTKTIYVDGSVYNTGVLNPFWDGVTNTANIRFSDEGGWRGLLADIAIYDYVLGLERVSLHYSASQNACL